MYQSVQFSCSVVSNSLWPHRLQHARTSCPSPTPGVYANSCSLSQWCHPTNSSSAVPFSSCPQSFPASGTFQVSQFFASGGQSIWVSASTSVLPINIQDWFPFRMYKWAYSKLRSWKPSWDFPSSPVVKTLHFQSLWLPGAVGSIPGQRIKIPQAQLCSQNVTIIIIY